LSTERLARRACGCSCRALASLAVFEALQPAAHVTGVHSRRVHYLFRDPATAPQEVRAPLRLARARVRARALTRPVAAAGGSARRGRARCATTGAARRVGRVWDVSAAAH
jgi:hypothetical protein